MQYIRMNETTFCNGEYYIRFRIATTKWRTRIQNIIVSFASRWVP